MNIETNKSYILKLKLILFSILCITSSWVYHSIECDIPQIKLKWDNCYNKFNKNIEIVDSNYSLNYYFWDIGTPNILYTKRKNGNFFKLIWNEDGTLMHRSLRSPIDTTPSGLYESYYDNSFPKEIGMYHKNRKINEWKYFNEDGTIYKIEIYDSLGNIIK